MSIRKAQSNDIPRIAELAAQRRVQYQQYQPQFWRIAELRQNAMYTVYKKRNPKNNL
jgi:hypothetical protein